jgi:hypothetical protein
MAVQRLNFTNRTRLNREQARFRVQPGPNDGDPATFAAEFDFSGLTADPGQGEVFNDANVFVEAYHKTTRMRFDFGTVAEVRQPKQRELSAFRDWADIKFRVRVTDMNERPGAVLAWADRIRPQAPNEAEGIDLVRFRDRELEGLLWDLEFDDAGPIVAVEKAAGGAQAVGRNPYFIAVAYPEILRRTLEYALIEEEIAATDEEHWFYQWHKGYLQKGLGLKGDVPEGRSERRQWINEAVEVFGRRFDVARIWPPSTMEEAD